MDFFKGVTLPEVPTVQVPTMSTPFSTTTPKPEDSETTPLAQASKTSTADNRALADEGPVAEEAQVRPPQPAPRPHLDVETAAAAVSASEEGVGVTVLVCVLRGRDLIPMDNAGPTNGFKAGSEPFVKVTLGDKHHSTQYQRSLSPVWKEQFMFTLRPEEVAAASLDVGVFDQDFDFSTPSTMGSFKVPLQPILDSEQFQRRWHPLEGKVDSDVRGKAVDAEGAVELLVDVVPAHRPTPPKPVPPATPRLVMMVLPALLWLVAFVYSVLAQLRAAILEGLAFGAIWLTFWLATGFHIKMRRVSIRFGFLVKGPTEIVVSGIEIVNPPGAYVQDECFLRLDHFVLHISVESVVRALLQKRRDPFSWPKISIPLVHVRGMKLVTEKAAGSPFCKPGEQLLNLYAFLGGKPDTASRKPTSDAGDEESKDAGDNTKNGSKPTKGLSSFLNFSGASQAAAAAQDGEIKGDGSSDQKGSKRKMDKDEEEDDQPNEHGSLMHPRKWEDLTPEEQKKHKSRLKRCMGVPYLFCMGTILLHDIELYLADGIADAMGNAKGLTSSKSAYIHKIILVNSDLNFGKSLILKRLVKKVMRATNMVGLMLDIAGQVATATGGKVSPTSVMGTLNSLTGGLFDDSD